jgi:cell wall assembly regulator SMI1
MAKKKPAAKPKAKAKPKKPAAKKPTKKATARRAKVEEKPIEPAPPARPVIVSRPPLIGGDRPAPAPTPAAPQIDHAARVATAWQRLEAFVDAGGGGLALNGPASDRAIAQAEKAMKVAFPADFRASLKVHDGQAEGAEFPWMPGVAPLWPVARIVEEHAKLQQQLAAKHQPKKETVDAHGKLKGGVYRTGRIPIADKTFLDLDPGPNGVAGQLITMTSKTDFVVIDASFGAALERWAGALERNIWVYDRARRAAFPRALPDVTGHPAGLFSRR